MAFPLLLLLCMLATVLVLVSGIVLMAIGGDANKHYGNKLMVARVACQAAAILLLGLMYFIYHGAN